MSDEPKPEQPQAEEPLTGGLDAGIGEIDFAKYRTDELFEQVSDLLNPGAVVWKVLKWVLLWMLVLAVTGLILFLGAETWVWLIVVVPLSLLFGMMTGLPFGLARAIRSAIDRLSQLLFLIMNTVQRIVSDCRDLTSGKQRLPSRRDLVYGVYAKVMLPTIEKVLVNRFGFLAKPVFWAYRLTLGRVVRGFVRKNVEDHSDAEVDAIAEKMEVVVNKIDEQHDVVQKTVAVGHERTSFVANIFKTGCSIPLYAMFGGTLLVTLVLLIGLRYFVTTAESTTESDEKPGIRNVNSDGIQIEGISENAENPEQ